SVQSIQFLDKVERKGRGLNLCLQTLDGILCHDGEIHNRLLKPCADNSFKVFKKKLNYKKNNPKAHFVPMTMEGCVVRMADTISYIGRDIEDAIRLSVIKRSDLPRESVEVIGNTNGTIVHNLVTDILLNSFRKNHIAFSEKVSNALKRLKEFNMQYIYLNPTIKKKYNFIKENFTILFEKYLEDLETKKTSSVIFTGFLKDMSEDYINNHNHAEIVRDFISGMTDKYFLRQCSDYVSKSHIQKSCQN
ncbi:MAG: phosphohydrolase, partial [Deltaproteobacteria bacterium]|nr:phosphohydrolase [Deltaproteobacteria bacterium]